MQKNERSEPNSKVDEYVDAILGNFLHGRNRGDNIKDFVINMATPNSKVNHKALAQIQDASLPAIATKITLPRHKSFSKTVIEGEIAMFGRQNRSMSRILQSELIS